MKNPLISIVTVVFNGEKFLEETILSVINQSYDNVEYIIIDGGSTDGTIDIIKKYEDKIDYWVSERDNGIYDAMNKGIELASGDLVGMINSDDYYLDDVFVKVIKSFEGKNLDEYIFWADIEYKNSIVKGWREENLKIGAFAPHPSMFCPKIIYDRIGTYKLWYKISADYDFMYRAIHKYKIKPLYLQDTVAFFRDGGVASQNIFRSLTEEMLVKIENGEKIYKAFCIYVLKLIKNYKKL